MSAMYISTNHGNVKASHFFKLQRKVPFSVYGLVRAGHKGHSVRVRKRSYFGVERLVLLPQRNCPKVSLKISNGVTLGHWLQRSSPSCRSTTMPSTSRRKNLTHIYICYTSGSMVHMTPTYLNLFKVW